MNSMDAFDVMKLAVEFSDPLRRFLDLETRLLTYANHPGVKLKEAARLLERRRPPAG